MSGRQIARASRRFRSGRVGFVLIMLASWVCRALRGAAFIPLYGSKTAPRKESSRMASVAPVRPESLMSSHLGLAGGCLCGALASCSVETGYPEAQFINFTMFGGMAIDNLAQACFSCVALVMKGVVFLSLAGWHAVAAIVECLLALPCSHVGLGSCCTASVIWPLIQQWSSYALNCRKPDPWNFFEPLSSPDAASLGPRHDATWPSMLCPCGLGAFIVILLICIYGMRQVSALRDIEGKLMHLRKVWLKVLQRFCKGDCPAEVFPAGGEVWCMVSVALITMLLVLASGIVVCSSGGPAYMCATSVAMCALSGWICFRAHAGADRKEGNAFLFCHNCLEFLLMCAMTHALSASRP